MTSGELLVICLMAQAPEGSFDLASSFEQEVPRIGQRFFAAYSSAFSEASSDE